MANQEPSTPEPTYGEGTAGVFRKGAINYPALLASAFFPFDSIAILRPVDIG